MGVITDIVYTASDIKSEKIKNMLVNHFIKKWINEIKIRKHTNQLLKIVKRFSEIEVLPISEVNQYLSLLFDKCKSVDFPIGSCIFIKMMGEGSYCAKFEYYLTDEEGYASDKVIVEYFFPNNNIRYSYLKNGIRTLTYTETNIKNLIIDQSTPKEVLFLNASKYSEQSIKTKTTFAKKIHNDISSYLSDILNDNKMPN